MAINPSARQMVIAAHAKLSQLNTRLGETQKEVETANNMYSDRGNTIAAMEEVVAGWKSDRATTRQMVLDLQLAMRHHGAPENLVEQCGKILGIF